MTWQYTLGKAEPRLTQGMTQDKGHIVWRGGEWRNVETPTLNLLRCYLTHRAVTVSCH